VLHHRRRTGKHVLRTFTLLLALLIAAPICWAQSNDEIDRREAALDEAWQQAPLAVRRAIFVSEHPDGFGMYTARSSNTFKPGEPLVTYAEPVGYGWKEIGKDMYEFGFAVDFLVKRPDGSILGGKQDFAKLVKQSHVRNREFMLTLTLDVNGADPGDYVLEYKLHDIASTKSTSFELPFKIAK
jgi:hypothetical protein